MRLEGSLYRFTVSRGLTTEIKDAEVEQRPEYSQHACNKPETFVLPLFMRLSGARQESEESCGLVPKFCSALPEVLKAPTEF
jgi:hypothetical protein